MAETLQQTPLYETHRALGARMMPFGGFDMPVRYSSIREEHLAVREAAGLFDVSHMGEVRVRGPKAFAFVQHLVTNDAERLYDGRAMYTVMCTPKGGIVDDLIVYRLGEEDYLLVINAANREKDIAWMQEHNPMEAVLEDVSEQTGLLAVQGPRSFDIVQQLVKPPLDELKFYHFLELPSGAFFGCEWAMISHTGYTGEKGLEIYCDAEKLPEVWNAVMEAGETAGLKPAGLGARDTLRLEAGLCLYGNELTEETNPLEAELGWLVKLEKDHFIGREPLQKIKDEGPARSLVGLTLEERGIPRAGYDILSEEEEVIGTVTSGTQSPVLEKGIGLGYVINEPAYTTPGVELAVSIRGRSRRAVITKPPFHK